MPANEIHVGDVGTIFELTIKDGPDIVPLQTATVQKAKFLKPDGECLIVDTSFVTDGSDGKVKYETVTDDLDQAGDWSIQFYVEMPAGKWNSEIKEFTVHENLDCV